MIMKRRQKSNRCKESQLLEVLAVLMLFFIVINLIQSRYFYNFFDSPIRLSIFCIFQVVLVILLSVFILVKVLRKTSVLIALYKLFYFKISMPIGAKIVISIVVIGNLLSVILAKPVYPFYDVGMFRWNSTFENKSEIVYKPKYYYYKYGALQILDLRKESFYFLSEHLGLGYNHEFTFATTYHNKSQKENFDFIVSKLKEQGIDTLWVGVHAVNYKTKKVWFDPDICNAIKINTTKEIHYGSIYIPEYQINRCDEN